MNWPNRQPSADQLSAIAARSKTRTHRIDDEPRRPAAPAAAARPFTPGEKSLIRRVHGYMPIGQLLGVLNERLQGDDPKAAPYTLEQLHAEIGAVAPVLSGDHDWASLRKLVAKARREGVLAKITRQVIDDFAVVYSLSSGQVLRLHDVLLRAQESEAQS